jgi:UDP-N-acetylmuramoyl-tripeptide--D-alanyl-D-alanine ligase
MKKILKKIIVIILTAEARLALWRWDPKIIAVTGSVGKTSTKDAIFAVFSKLARARKSEKSFNSELGVPLAILGLTNVWSNPILWLLNIIRGFFICFVGEKPMEWLILEIGADRPGDIKNLTRWIKPDITVINKIGDLPVHVEFFESPAALAKEKAELARVIKPGGSLVAYFDDEKVMKIAEGSKSRSVITFGFNEKADIFASNYAVTCKKIGDINTPSGISFKVNVGGNVLPIIVYGALGRGHAYSALAALGAAFSAKQNIVAAAEALREHKTPPGRMKLIEGIKSSIIIDDSYNSSPAALEEALQALKTIETSGRKIAVLGDMLELGSYSREAHWRAGRVAAEACDILGIVGVEAKMIAEGALDAGMSEKNIYEYENSAEAGEDIQNLIQKGDIVLVKGSQGVRMEKVVEEIMAEPEKASELLVRQEKDWKNR